MSLSQKSKKFFVRHYDENSLTGVFLMVGTIIGGVYSIATGIFEESDTGAPVTITAAQAQEEARVFNQGMTEAFALARKADSYGHKLTELERVVSKGEDAVAKTALDDLRLEQMKQRVSFEQKAADMSHYLLVKSNLPEAQYDKMIEGLKPKSPNAEATAVLDKLYHVTNYRDECRIDLAAKDPSYMSDREKADFVTACSKDNLGDNSVVTALGAFGGMFGSMFLAFGLMGRGTRLREKWMEEERDEVRAKRHEEFRRIEAEKIIASPETPAALEEEPPAKRETPRLRL